jgi:polyisoprenoid-binding protein YceI
MRRTITIFTLLVLLLAACSAQATPVLPDTSTEAPAATAAAPTQAAEPTAVPPTDTAAETAAPEPTAAEPVTAEPTAAPTEAGGAATGVVIYRMVPEESRVTYEVNETFINQGNVINTAIGVTSGVSGTVQVDFDNAQNSIPGAMTVDISQFVSDSGRRDNAIRGRFLQSAQFPIATFVSTSVQGLPDQVQTGVDYPLTISGDLTIRETTRPVTFDAVVRLEGDSLIGSATTTILMSDFGFGPIDILGTLKTEDEVKTTVEFVARP